MTHLALRHFAPLALIATPLLACKPPASKSPVAPASAAPGPGSLRTDLSADQLTLAARGKALFQKRYTPAEGLGPYFNFEACGSCHDTPASGGHGDKAHAARNVILGNDLTGLPLRAIPGFQPLQKAQGALESRPVPPLLYGLGLIEALDETQLAAACGQDAALGIRGVANVNPGKGKMARFGLKGHAVTVRDFVATALNLEMGMTNPYERDPRNQKDQDAVPDPEVPAQDVDAIVAYVQALAPPPPPAPNPQQEAAFARLGCATCHRPQTGPGVRAYSDLCLHDMGPAFDNGMPDFRATGSMWRTPPLWGLRWRDRYFHDGRGSDLVAAILSHGGEAQKPRDRFAQLPAAEQQAFAEWLKTL